MTFDYGGDGKLRTRTTASETRTYRYDRGWNAVNEEVGGSTLYNDMGHREDVWEHETFKALIKEHLLWVSGKGMLNADPNYTETVTETVS